MCVIMKELSHSVFLRHSNHGNNLDYAALCQCWMMLLCHWTLRCVHGRYSMIACWPCANFTICMMCEGAEAGQPRYRLTRCTCCQTTWEVFPSQPCEVCYKPNNLSRSTHVLIPDAPRLLDWAIIGLKLCGLIPDIIYCIDCRRRPNIFIFCTFTVVYVRI